MRAKKETQDQRIAFVRDNASKMTSAEIAKHLGVTTMTIGRIRGALGISEYKSPRRFFAEKREAFTLFEQGVSSRKIAKSLNLSLFAIVSWRKQFTAQKLNLLPNETTNNLNPQSHPLPDA